MNMQFRLTEEIKNADVHVLELGNRETHILQRRECKTVGDVVANLEKIKMTKGTGVLTMKNIVSSVVDYMIANLPDKELVEWFKYLVNNNTAEELRGIIEGLEAA